MALLWFDSSSWYDTANLQHRIYNTNNYDDVVSEASGESQYHHRVDQTFSGGCTAHFSSGESNTNVLIFGYDYWLPEDCPTTNGMTVFLDGDEQFSLMPMPDGSFQARRGTYYGTLLGTSDPGLFYPGVWNFIELKLKIDNSPNGYFYVRVNGKDVFSMTGIDTQQEATGGANRFVIKGSGQDEGIMNYYIADDSGSYNNDFLGPVWIRAEAPYTSGEHQDWTASGESTNLACIDDTGDTPPTISYSTGLLSTSDGDADTYKFTLTENVQGEEILAVSTSFFAISYEGDTPSEGASVGALYKTETTFQKSGESGVRPWFAKDSEQGYQAIWDRNPSGEIAWTREAINSGEFGVQLNVGVY